MTESELSRPRESFALEYYEEAIPIRGCSLTMANIQHLYRELQKINSEFGKSKVANLHRDYGLSDEEWERKKGHLLDDAFRLTTTVTGDRDQHIYGEDETIFQSTDLTLPIKSIYFTNITAYKRHANGQIPQNAIEVTLDFGKPDLTDASLVVSEPTPNNSRVLIRAQDISFFRAARQIVDTKLANHRSRFGFLHVNFAYDFGLWLLALPSILLLATYYMDVLFPIGGTYSSYRWAFFVYVSGLGLLGYRFLNSYAKWAFPVNVLAENKDRAWRHRLILGGASLWIFYQIIDVIYGLTFR